VQSSFKTHHMRVCNLTIIKKIIIIIIKKEEEEEEEEVKKHIEFEFKMYTPVLRGLYHFSVHHGSYGTILHIYEP
jgi:hypothetical protein